jgi:hypothetical protein
MSDDDTLLRELVGETVGRFALGDTSISESDLIDVVDMDLTLEAQTLAEVFSPHSRRIAELFCTP